jgi:hypothetical protein
MRVGSDHFGPKRDSPAGAVASVKPMGTVMSGHPIVMETYPGDH